MRTALALYGALHKVGAALPARGNIERKAHFQRIAVIVYFINFIGIALYIAVECKIYGVKYGGLTAASLAEYSEYSAL